jgi:hypothetical protein
MTDKQYFDTHVSKYTTMQRESDKYWIGTKEWRDAITKEHTEYIQNKGKTSEQNWWYKNIIEPLLDGIVTTKRQTPPPYTWNLTGRLDPTSYAYYNNQTYLPPPPTTQRLETQTNHQNKVAQKGNIQTGPKGKSTQQTDRTTTQPTQVITCQFNKQP